MACLDGKVKRSKYMIKLGSRLGRVQRRGLHVDTTAYYSGSLCEYYRIISSQSGHVITFDCCQIAADLAC